MPMTQHVDLWLDNPWFQNESEITFFLLYRCNSTIKIFKNSTGDDAIMPNHHHHHHQSQTTSDISFIRSSTKPILGLHSILTSIDMTACRLSMGKSGRPSEFVSCEIIVVANERSFVRLQKSKSKK